MNKTKHTHIPELRFPEFKNDGEWEEKTLGNCFNNIGGKPLEKFTSKDEKYHFISIGNYSKDGRYLDNGQRIALNDITKLKILNKDDLVMVLNDKTKSGDIIGSTILIEESDKYIYNQRSERLITKSMLIPNFSWYLLNSENIRKTIFNNSQGGTQIYVNFSSIKNININYPKNKKEQQKIAACLSSLDELIEGHSQKLELLEEHKKGLLQNLFPQKGKKHPAYRFPEFKNNGDWEEKTLGDICNITNGKANAQDHKENGRYPLFDRSEIVKASDIFIFDCEVVIIPGEGMRFIPKYYKGKFNLHQRAYALKDFSCNGKFVYYSMFYRSHLMSQRAVQSTVLSLRLPILQQFPIDIPSNPKEQQKIAACLSSLDELIKEQKQKIEQLKQHKRGLMQKLFVK